MDTTSRSRFPAWPPFAVFAAAAAYLALRWDRIPDRWTTHWDIAGAPNGWSERTAAGVFGPIVLGVAIVGFVESLLAMVPRGPEAGALRPVREAGVYCARMVTFAVSVLLGVVAVVLPLGPPLPALAIVGVALALPAVAMGFGARRVRAALRDVRQAGHADKVEGYRGLFYANASDRRLWVPKLTGLGTTINFGHPWAWPVMVLLTGLPIALLVVLFVAAHRP